MGSWQDGIEGLGGMARRVNGDIVGTVAKEQLGYDWRGKGSSSKAEVQSLQVRSSLFSPCIQYENITAC